MENILARDVSPALRGLVGYLADHPRFVLTPHSFTGTFDNGKKETIHGKRVHNTGERDEDDTYLADVEGEVFVFSEAGAQPLCACSEPGRVAVDAFRELLGPAAFLVV